MAGQFRPSRRPMWLAIGINVTVAALFLGVPYVRGRLRAHDTRSGFARFSACLLRGEAVADPGLGLPRGDRDHYASAVLHAEKGWPARCIEPLHAIAPSPVKFLFPGAKQAEHDVRAAVDLVERELSTLAEQRAEGLDAVPSRPWRAVSKLRAALSLLAEASGATGELQQDAVTLKDSRPLADPARVPLRAAYDAQLRLWRRGNGVEALAMDSRGVSWVRVDAGKVQQRRARRPSLLRAIHRDGSRSYLVWAMPESRCAEADDHCLHHATGLARVDGAELRPLPEPLWLAGHPVGRPDRSLRIEDRAATLLARASTEGAAELRMFELPQRSGKDDALPEKPIPASNTWPLPDSPLDALLVSGPHPGLLWASPQEASMQISWRPRRGTALALGSLQGASPWLESCASKRERWLVYASSTQIGIGHIASDGTLRSLAPMRGRAAHPLHATRPTLDTAKTACTSQRLHMVFRDEGGTLKSLRCAIEEAAEAPQCGKPRSLAQDVETLAVATHRNGAVVAYSASKTSSFVHVQQLNENGAPEGPAEVPAACWKPAEGFCGAPTWVDGEPLLLGARERGDLRVVELDPDGRWQPLEALRHETRESSASKPNARIARP